MCQQTWEEFPAFGAQRPNADDSSMERVENILLEYFYLAGKNRIRILSNMISATQSINDCIFDLNEVEFENRILLACFTGFHSI